MHDKEGQCVPLVASQTAGAGPVGSIADLPPMSDNCLYKCFATGVDLQSVVVGCRIQKDQNSIYADAQCRQ